MPQLRLGPAESTGGLLVGQPFQVAEDHRQPLMVGQSFDLLVDDRCDLDIGAGAGSPEGGHRRRRDLAPSPPRLVARPARRRDRRRGAASRPGPRRRRPSARSRASINRSLRYGASDPSSVMVESMVVTTQTRFQGYSSCAVHLSCVPLESSNPRSFQRPCRSARPGCARVCRPSSSTSCPLTITKRIPVLNWNGSR